MQCAVSNGCRSLGVATGRFSADELIQIGADSVVDDLSDTEKIAAWILNDT
jgi:phosphoglycolate phosphatase-like HAD superfamily hydrolase